MIEPPPLPRVGSAPEAAPEAFQNCPNCHHRLALPRPNYCGHCGQETALKPPTVLEFLQQFGGSYISMEGALWRTLGLLLFRPGQLTRQYLAGRRRRYVLPLRLYLTISLVALLALRLSGALHGPDGDQTVLKLDKPPDAELSFVALGDVRVSMEKGSFRCEGLPAAWCERLRERFTLDAKSMARELREVPARFVSHWGSAMFALLPLFAWLLKLVYLNRGLRWSEHLVFALHLHAFWFAMLATQLTGVGWLQAAAALAVPVYSVRALQVVYGGRWWATALRVGTLLLMYGIVLCVAMAVVAVWAFLA